MKPHVGLISQWYDPERGSAAQSGVIARSLLEQGHEVDVVTGFPNYPTGKIYDGYALKLYQRERLSGVRVHRGPLYPSHDANAARRSVNYLTFAVGATGVAVRHLAAVDVCLVHATPATAALPAMVLRLLRGTPYVVHVHDLWPDSVLSSGFLRGWQSRLAARVLHGYCDAMYRGAAAVAVTSPGMAAKIEGRGVPPEKIHFVPNWADEDVFRPTVVDPALRAELGLSAAVTVMYAGNLGEYQDLGAVVEAAGILRERSDIEFVFVGEGVERQNLQNRAAALQLTNIRFLGARAFAQMPQLLAVGDVQLVTLRDLDIFTTTLPSKLVATLASGRPILGGLTGDAADLVRSSGAGEVVPPGDPRACRGGVVLLPPPPGPEHGRHPAERAPRRGRAEREGNLPMTVGVVGANGFVGGAVIGALTARGVTCSGVRAPRLAPVEPRGTRLAIAGLTSVVDELANSFMGLDAVVNAAGDPDASSRDTAALVAANAVLPLLLARAAAAAGVRRFVHISSAVVQGRRPVLDESEDIEAFSDYSRSKALAEELLRQQGDERVVIYRPPSVHSGDRRVTRALAAISRSPLSTVAHPGTAPTPQAHVDNVGDAIAFLALCSEQPPPIVIHPWEGFTTAEFLELLGGRPPRRIPTWLASSTTAALRAAGGKVKPVAANARRLEMMWQGQGQAVSWLEQSGWVAPAGRDAWLRTAAAARAGIPTKRGTGWTR